MTPTRLAAEIEAQRRALKATRAAATLLLDLERTPAHVEALQRLAALGAVLEDELFALRYAASHQAVTA